MLIVPPGSGICHQVNLEYLGRVVFNTKGILYPDSLVGTDSHTTMINGLGVTGWGMYMLQAPNIPTAIPKLYNTCTTTTVPELYALNVYFRIVRC